LPRSEFIDTEVSTNIPFRLKRTDTTSVDIKIRIDGTANNCLVVAFGQDSNSNGNLDFEEIDTVYGWRGGRYVIENVKGWERIESRAANDGTGGSIDINIRNTLDVVPCRFSAICGGAVAFKKLSDNPPPWLYRREWNMMRVFRRGEAVSGDQVSCDMRYPSFSLIVR